MLSTKHKNLLLDTVDYAFKYLHAVGAADVWADNSRNPWSCPPDRDCGAPTCVVGPKGLPSCPLLPPTRLVVVFGSRGTVPVILSRFLNLPFDGKWVFFGPPFITSYCWKQVARREIKPRPPKERKLWTTSSTTMRYRSAQILEGATCSSFFALALRFRAYRARHRHMVTEKPDPTSLRKNS